MFLLIDGSSLLTTNFMGNLPPEIKFCKDDDKYDRQNPAYIKWNIHKWCVFNTHGYYEYHPYS